MTVTSCRLDKVTGGRQHDNDFDHYAEYIIDTDDKNMSNLAVLQGARNATTGLPDPIPNMYQAYSLLGDVDNGSLAREFDLNRDTEKTTRWRCRVTWKPLDPGKLPGDELNPPTSRPTRQWMEWLTVEEAVEKDKDGKPIVNTAGQEFDTPLMVEKRYMVLCSRNYYDTMTAIEDVQDQYENSVNSDVFRTRAVRTWRFLGIDTEQPESHDGTTNWPGVIRLAYKETTWDVELLQRGHHYLKNPGVDDELVPFRRDGSHSGEPGLLDASGGKLAKGLTGVFGTPYRIYREVAFTGIVP